MLSKVFNTTLNGIFRAQPNILSKSFTFCTSTTQRHETHPLRNKIMGLSSFDEFNTFFKDKNKQFDPSCYSMASRTLAKILIESRLVFNFNHREALKVYLSNLQKVDIEALNLQQFSQLLYLLRVLKHDPVNNNAFVRQYIRSIFDRSEPKLKELEAETSLNRLSYFYQEYSSLGVKQASVLAKRINQFIRSNNPEVEAQHLTLNEINLVLKGMRSKKYISFDELLLFKNVVKTVLEKYFDKISFFELAQISVSVNEVNSLNPNDIVPFNSTDQIHKRVLSNIDEMDEKSIMYILNGQKTANKVYTQIYKVIFEKILDEIQPNGESSFNELFTLRLFNGISNKVRLQSTTPENQEKFFAFFRQAVTKTPRFINSFVETYIENGFFNNKHLGRLLEILQSIPDFNCKLTLLHALAKRRVNIQKLTNIDMAKEIEVKEKNLIMLIFIIESIVEQNPSDKQKYAEHLGKMKARFFELYKVEDDSFSKLMTSIPNDLIETLIRGLRREIEQKFPNPFETEQSEKYRAAWLKLQVFGSNELQFSKKYAPVLKDKVTATDLTKLLKTLSYIGYSSNDSVSNVLNLITKRFDLLLNDDELLRSTGSLMQNEVASIFESGNSELIKNRYWHVLNDCFEKLEPSKFFTHFNPVIILILKLATYDFMYSSQYHSFLLKLLQKSEHIKNRNLPSDLLEECLKLNLIKRADIPNLSPNMLENLPQNQKLMLKMIQTNDFALEGVELNRNNLHLYLYNICDRTREQLLKNRQKVLNIISDMKVKDLWKCLIHYRLGPKKNQAELVEALLKQISKFKLRYEEFSPVFIAEVFKRNNLDKAFIKLDGIKAFFKSSMEYFTDKRNIGKIPLEDHIEIIKSANDFKVRSQPYAHEILNYYHGDLNFFTRELYLLAGNLGITLSKKEMERLIEVNFFTGFNASFSKCLNIFLLNENEIPTPGEHLKTIIGKYNELSAKEKVPIYSLYFEYLKKAYPEQTKDWQPNQIEKADFSKSLQTLNLKNLTWLIQVVEEVTKQKWVENVVSNNYYYTFRNVAITFPYQTRYFGENNLLRKVMSKLTGIEKVIVLNKRQTGLKSALKYIMQLDQKLFSTTQEAEILKKFEQRIEQGKTAAGEEEAEDVAEEHAKEEKGKN